MVSISPVQGPLIVPFL